MTEGPSRPPSEATPPFEGLDYFFVVFFPPLAFFGSFFASPLVWWLTPRLLQLRDPAPCEAVRPSLFGEAAARRHRSGSGPKVMRPLPSWPAMTRVVPSAVSNTVTDAPWSPRRRPSASTPGRPAA